MENKKIETFSVKLNKVRNIIKSFSITEKTVLSFFIIIFSISTLMILFKVNNNYLIAVPDKGGILIEGIIGTPRFINPVIANSNVDKDLSSIIYSGLTKIDGHGQIKLDLTERYEISENGLIYDFYLKDNVVFHDNKILTTDDVIFTILKVKDPEIRSPYIADWEKIVLEKVSDRQIRFILEKPDSNFLYKTTIGILPRHLWQEITNDAFSLNLFNIEPIGSGPYQLSKIERDNINIPKNYTLSSFKKYALNEPLIKKIIFKFVKNEDELVELANTKQINAISNISPESLEKITNKKNKIININLPRVFGLFINQSESPALSIKSAREALKSATPKDQIINDVFKNYAQKANSPIPNFVDENSFQYNLEEAEQILIKDGWTKNNDGIYALTRNNENYILSTSISTSNVPELIKVAEIISNEWKKIGVDVSVKIFSSSDLNQNVIRPRNFEILLFGNSINNHSDLYAFWHSSRRNDPGLNITSYANIETDSLLDKFLNTNQAEIEAEDVNRFITEIKKDIPAIFLYNPQFIYLLSEEIKGVEITKISNAHNRFGDIEKWFINTDKIWKIFLKNN